MSEHSMNQTLPWENRSEVGFVEALVATIRLLVTAPAEAFGRLRPNGDLVGPLLFGLLLSWLGVIVSLAWNILFGGVRTALTGEVAATGVVAGVGIIYAVLFSVIWPVLYLVGVFVGAGLYQLGLMMVGGLDNSEHHFEGTVKVVCYSAVANLAQVIPLLGTLIMLVAMIAMMVIGLATVHRTSHGKAAAGVLVPMFLCCVCGLILSLASGALLGFLASQAG